MIRKGLTCAIAALATGTVILVASSARAQPADADVEVGAAPKSPAAAPPQKPELTPHGVVGAPLMPPAPTPSVDVAALQQELAATKARVEKLEHAAEQPSVTSRLLPAGVAIGGYVQGQYEHHQDSSDEVLNGQFLNENRFVLRRGRIRFDGAWEFAEMVLELDANTVNGPAISIRRAEATLVYRDHPFTGEVTRHSPREVKPPLAAFTVGVTDIPFGFELLDSPRDRVFMERTQGSTAFFPSEPDVGMRLWGGAGFFRYQLALLNGEPLNEASSAPPAGDPTNAKDFVARLGIDAHPFKGARVLAGVSVDRGKGFHAGSSATKNGIVWNDTNQNGVIDAGELVPAPGSAAEPSVEFDRWGVNGDLEIWVDTPIGKTMLYGELTVASNLDRGFLPADPTLTGIDVREVAGYAAVTQEVTPYGLLGFRFDVYDPNADFLDSRQGNLIPTSARVTTLSPVGGLVLPPDRARLLFQYDFVRDSLGRDSRGVPTDLANDRWTVRLQVQM